MQQLHYIISNITVMCVLASFFQLILTYDDDHQPLTAIFHALGWIV